MYSFIYQHDGVAVGCLLTTAAWNTNFCGHCRPYSTCGFWIMVFTSVCLVFLLHHLQFLHKECPLILLKSVQQSIKANKDVFKEYPRNTTWVLNQLTCWHVRAGGFFHAQMANVAIFVVKWLPLHFFLSRQPTAYKSWSIILTVSFFI